MRKIVMIAALVLALGACGDITGVEEAREQDGKVMLCELNVDMDSSVALSLIGGDPKDTVNFLGLTVLPKGSTAWFEIAPGQKISIGVTNNSATHMFYDGKKLPVIEFFSSFGAQTTSGNIVIEKKSLVVFQIHQMEFKNGIFTADIPGFKALRFSAGQTDVKASKILETGIDFSTYVFAYHVLVFSCSDTCSAVFAAPDGITNITEDYTARKPSRIAANKVSLSCRKYTKAEAAAKRLVLHPIAL